MSGTFQGLNPALRLQVYHRLINLDVIWKGRYYGAVATFLVADKRHSNGLFSNLIDTAPEATCLSLNSLVIRDCYEGLLTWCNQNLDSKSWIALYQYSNSELTLPRLQHKPEQEEEPERLKLLCVLPLAKQRI